MGPEPYRESTMDKRALANDLQIADMDGTSSSTGDDEEGQTEESLPASDHNSTLVQNGDCRYCFAPAKASGKDPIIELGCQCKDDLRYGHESCLTKWIVRRLNRDGTLDCELCRSSLGAHLKVIVGNKIKEAQGVRVVRLLLQLPREELDCLQVPLLTPNFSDLPWETRVALVVSMDRQEEMHLRGETRQSATLTMAYILAVISANHADDPLTVNEIQASIREAAEIRNQILGGSLELVDLFPYDEEQDTDANAVDEDMDESDQEQILDCNDYEPHTQLKMTKNQILTKKQTVTKNIDLFPYDVEQNTDANAVDEYMDGSDQEQILDSNNNEPHTVENDEEPSDIDKEPFDSDGELEEEEPSNSDEGPSDSDEEPEERDIDEAHEIDEAPDMDDDRMEFYAFWDRLIVRLDEDHLLPSGEELEAYVDDLAADGAGAMFLHEFLRFYLEDDEGRRESTYGRHRIFLLRDIPQGEVHTRGTENVGGTR